MRYRMYATSAKIVEETRIVEHMTEDDYKWLVSGPVYRRILCYDTLHVQTRFRWLSKIAGKVAGWVHSA